MTADDTLRNPTRRSILAGAAATLAVTASFRPVWAADAPGDEIRPLTLVAKTQVSDPSAFQAAQLIVQEWRKLGLKINLQVVPQAQRSEIVWLNRDTWDLTMWEMVGRPERSDPDELVYSLFHSSLAKTGYNFVGYNSSEYDRLAEAQRAEVNVEKRRALVKESQKVIARDQPYVFLVHPKRAAAFNANVWDEKTIFEEAGIGIRNFWTFIAATPKGAQKDMVTNGHEAITSIRPVRMDPVGSWIQDMIWDKLVRVDLNGEPKPWAAESVRFVDPTTVEAVIRDGMMFHDGKPVTLEDIKFSFEMPAIPGKAPMYAPFVKEIASIELTGPKTMVFKLKSPQAAFFIGTLSKINIVPKHVWQPIIAALGPADTIENYQEEMPIGSGPFKFVHWRKREEVMLDRVATHWAAPKMNRWILRIVPNQEATLGMLRNGEMNFLAIFTGDPETVVELGKQVPNIKVVVTTDLGMQYVGFNIRRAPFNDPAFRRALSMAISRPMMVAAAWNGFAEPAGSAVSTALPAWHEDSSVMMGGDLKKARQMLEEAGYKLRKGQLTYPAGKKEDLASLK